MQKPVEAPEELPTEEAGGGRGKEAGKEPQEPILQPIPMNLNPNATAQPQNSPLPVYILPTPAAKLKTCSTYSQSSCQSITACTKYQEVSGHC